jgi:hypothetical protein
MAVNVMEGWTSIRDEPWDTEKPSTNGRGSMYIAATNDSQLQILWFFIDPLLTMVE